MSGARLGRFLRILLAIAGGAGIAYAVTHFGGLWLATAVMIVVLALLLWSSR